MWRERRNHYGPTLSTMDLFRRIYRGEVQVNLPEIGQHKTPLSGDIIAQGLDQLSQRVASTFPDLYCPPLKRGVEKYERNADTKRMAYTSWMQKANYDLLTHQSARWLIGYGSAPKMVRPDFTKGIPTWRAYDPQQTYPAIMRDPVNMTPDDVIFSYAVSTGWLKRRYPEQAARLMKPKHPNARITLLEYIDAEVHCLLAFSASVDFPANTFPQDTDGSSHVEILEVAPNRAGICWAVVPNRITLDSEPVGQFAKAVNLFLEQAKLMNLAVVAAIKGIFPDLVVQSSDPNTVPIVNDGGNWHDGRTGKVNVISGGQFTQEQTNPGYMTMPMIDRLESYVRETGGIPSELQGEASSNIRTGRRGAQVLSSVIDFPILEYQKILARSAEEELYRAGKIAKAYFGNEPKSFFVSYGKTKGVVDYVPNKHFDTDEVQVTYSSAGADVNGLTIAVGQLIGLELMSKKEARRKHPLIDNPDETGDEFIAEQLESSILVEMLQPGSMSVVDKARVAELVRQNKMDLPEAIAQVQKEAQTRQATAGPPGTPEGPVPPGSPEAQPGIVPPGLGAEAGVVPEPTPSVQNLAQLLGNLRRPQMTLPSERAS